MVDNVYRTRSLGTAAEGLRDQYADGKAARVWEVYIGDKSSRTENYRNFITSLLKEKKCQTVLDLACGTGIDSIMLLEEGFQVTSIDASDKMLKYALKKRWARRKEEPFDNWVVEEANWLTLDSEQDFLKGGFDAVICLGNSFAHLPDFGGDLKNQRTAIANFASCVKPGGLLLIDHRNYDYILNNCSTPAKNIYYNSNHIVDIKTSVLNVNGRPTLVTMDYIMDIPSMGIEHESFRLSYYPHRLDEFKGLLKEAFGETCNHTVFGDFKPLEEIPEPAFYIHLVEKPSIE